MPSYGPTIFKLSVSSSLRKSLNLFEFNRRYHFLPRPPPRRHQFRVATAAFPYCSCSRPRPASGLLKCVGSYNGSSSSVLPYMYQQSLGYGRYAYDEYASEEEEAYQSDQKDGKMSDATLDNIEDWRRRLTDLWRSKDQQELVSKEKKDRRDFQHLSALATRMDLYSNQYSRVVVFSKVPLPNYRPDLDDKRPQREVILPSRLHDRLDAHLEHFLSQKARDKDLLAHSGFSRSTSNDTLSKDDRLLEFQETTPSVAAERILRQRSINIRNKQQDWQGSAEGQKMQEFRKSLPSYKERETLLQMISNNQVVVMSGETGCGKTTQLPQYILESEIEAARGAYCNIICTQPRRISAMSVAERVAAERGEKLGESVGYKVRLEGMRGRDTRLLFCTTGILLRKLLVDNNLKGVTHVIVDEIHERGMNEDFLLIVLKDLLPRRPELRLVLMSATLNADLFSSYFHGAPMIHIPGFTHPVRSNFLENILEITGYGLTPNNQIDDYGQDKLWKTQRQSLRRSKTQIASAVEAAHDMADYRNYSLHTRRSISCWNPDSIGFNLIENVLCHICQRERPGAILVFMMGWDDINALKSQLQKHHLLGNQSKVLLLACHGSMASAEQRLIFDKPEDGIRKIVLATNMAETSITINDVVFVVDCGKAKETSYDALNNTPCLLPAWISKASARQRRGRAGRVQPGECYHLYPRYVHDAFSDYQMPELLRTPLQSLCLQIKSLRLGSISDFLSKALQAPELLSVQNAIEYLKSIGALDDNEDLTLLGRNLSHLPVEPKLGKMLIYGSIFKCLDPIMTVVASLSARDPFLMPFDKKDLAESAKAQFSSQEYSDHLTLIRAYDGWKEAEKSQSGYEYCWRNFLSAQTLTAIDSLRKQFFHQLKDSGLVNNIESCNKWSHDEQLVRAVLCAGLFPGICSVVNKERSMSLKTMEDGSVLLHSNSVNAQQLNIPYPWLVFNEKVKVNSVFLRDSTALSDSIVLLFGGKIAQGGMDGHLKMLGGYLEFFMKPSLAGTYLRLKKELDQLTEWKLENPKLDTSTYDELLSVVSSLLAQDRCEGRFVYGYQLPASSGKAKKEVPAGKLSKSAGGDNSKSHLQTLLARAGHQPPSYKTKALKNNNFRSTVMFSGLDFVGQPRGSKKEAEKDAATEALRWLTGQSQSDGETVDHISAVVKKSKKKHETARWR